MTTMKPSDTDEIDTRPPLTHEAIATRAYEIFCDRGGQFGDGGHDEDWCLAEAELRARRETESP